jgi:SAM-dependent methyltransferase
MGNIKKLLKKYINTALGKFGYSISKYNGFLLKKDGFCNICDKQTIFEADDQNLRESFGCIYCSSNPRERAMLLIINKYIPEWKELTIYEFSPKENGLSLYLRNNCKKYKSSHYYPDKIFGKLYGDHYNENLEELTLSNNSVDIVITGDVLEHLYEPEKAFSEIARILKNGGYHIFTVPIANSKKTEVWAIKGKNGEPIFLKTEEWHGNPISDKGSAVTIHFGYDIIDIIKNSSGMETIIERPFKINLGICTGFKENSFVELFVSKK